MARWTVVGALAACGEVPLEVPAPLDTGRCTEREPLVGLGEVDEVGYRPLEPGDEVRVVHGAQGGWHVDVAGRVVGAGPEVAVQVTLTETSGREISGAQGAAWLGLADHDEASCAGTFTDVHAMIDAQLDRTDAEVVCGLDRQAVVLAVEVTTGSGAVATARLPVVALVDAVDLEACDGAAGSE
jgi:hypothetical protein